MLKQPENGYFALVLTCAVCLFAIALVSWSVPYSEGYKRADQDHQAAYATHDTAEKYERECSRELTIKKALRCYRDAYNTDREQERAEEDLDAQREMANWAEGMLWATVAVGSITAGVTGLGVWYVAQTLSATSATLAAANKANEIMRDEQRPWVSLSRDVECDLFESSWGVRVAWNYNLENFGRSPAHQIRLKCKAVRTDYLSGLGEELEALVQSEIGQSRLTDTPVLFPGKKTENWRYHSDFGLSFTPHKEDVSGHHTIVLICLTYRHGTSTDAETGVEARVMGFEERKDTIGPFGHKMLEYANFRIVR